MTAVAASALLLALFATLQAASRAPARGRSGMVASSEENATRIGLEVLRRGGNAVDAAVAVGFALAVTHPAAGNLGGGGFMLIRKSDGTTFVIDYREAAPGKAARDMYLGTDGKPAPDLSTVGHKAVAVPGTVAGLALALEKFGTISLEEALRPAIGLAEQGFKVSYALSRSLERNRDLLARFPESRRIFLRDGTLYREGDLLVQKELAATLKEIARGGAQAFYRGKIADLLVAEMESGGGLITREDLENYRPVLRAPLRGSYRGYEVISAPPPSSGGTALIQMLNILEGFQLARYGHNSSRSLHIIAEAMRLAFADRAAYLGDADFVKVPVSGLISKKYAAALRSSIDPYLAGKSADLKRPEPQGFEGEETTHYSVVDRWGNAVANTYTINGSYGSGVTVRGAGFLLNNEMDDFTVHPGAPNMFELIQGEANAIAPRKRPLSSMTPTILTKNGKLFMVLGSPGGPTIINNVLQVILNVVDFGLDIQAAVDAPRIHHQWLPDLIFVERNSLPADVLESLRARGHQIREREAMGDVQAIMVDPEEGTLLGAADSRRDGRALGY